MTDPLDALREPVTPVDPDPAFAAELRSRLERALLVPPGVAMTTAVETTPHTLAVISLWTTPAVRWTSTPGPSAPGAVVRRS